MIINKLAISSLIIVLIFVVGVGYYFFVVRYDLFSLNNGAPNITKSEDKDTGSSTKKIDLVFEKNDSFNFKTNEASSYIEKASSDLSKIDDERIRLSAKISLSLVYPYTALITDQAKRSDATVRSYNDLYDFYKESVFLEGDTKNSWLRAKPLLFLTLIYQESCFQYRELYISKWSNHPAYVSSNIKYPNNKQLAAHVFLLDLLKGEDIRESLSVGQRIFILARILDNFESEISEEDRNLYIKELSLLVDRYPSMPESPSFPREDKRIILPIIYYSFGLAVLSNFDQKYSKDMVLKNYAEKESIIKSYLNTGRSSNLGYFVLFESFYLKFLFEENGGIIDNDTKFLIKELIDTVEKIPKVDQTILTGILFYYQNTQTDMGNWDRVRQVMFEIGKKDKDMKAFLVNYGVVFK
jgi:hypothetical protein